VKSTSPSRPGTHRVPLAATTSFATEIVAAKPGQETRVYVGPQELPETASSTMSARSSTTEPPSLERGLHPAARERAQWHWLQPLLLRLLLMPGLLGRWLKVHTLLLVEYLWHEPQRVIFELVCESLKLRPSKLPRTV